MRGTHNQSVGRGTLVALLVLIGSSCATARSNPEPPDPNLTCRLSRYPATFVDSLKKLPAAVQAALKKMAGAMADRGEFFNAGDVVSKPAPFNRFIRGGKSGEHWFVWYEHGGFAYWHQIVIFAADPKKEPLFNGRSTTADLCAMTDGLLDRPRP